MWKIWKEEVCKIASRKIIWLGIFSLLVFIQWRLAAETASYSMTAGGQTYYGREALKKDKELAAEYAGMLTKEKADKIYETYGFYYYDAERGEYVGNFCNKFITEEMTDFRQTDGESPEEITFLQGEQWQNNVAPLLEGNIRFDYVYGWQDLREMFMMADIALCVIFMIGLSPVFAEEYTLKTAGLLLTTERGKKSGIWMKIAAAVSFTTIVYCVFILCIWGFYLNVYGTQGLDASPVILGLPASGYYPVKISSFLLFEFALGLAGELLLCGITLAVSAKCKSAFLSVIVSVALFFVPYVWMNVFAVMLAPLLGNELVKAVSHFMVSMPFYLSVNWGFGFTEKQIALHLAIALAAGISGGVRGYCRYRNYEG